MKQRDTEFDQRSIVIERKWIEKVSPRAEIAKRAFNDFKFGQETDPILAAGEKVPDDYEQPHRVRTRLTVRESEVTIDMLESLAKPKYPKFGWKDATNARWSSAGGTERFLDHATGEIRNERKPALNGILRMYQRSFEWCCGYGVAKWMTSIDSVRVADDRLILKGKLRLLGDDTSALEMELDRDRIVRKVLIAIPGQGGGGGFDTYEVETRGTVRPDIGPPFSESGHYRRILKSAGKPDSVVDDYEIKFISASARLSDEEYHTHTEIRARAGRESSDPALDPTAGLPNSDDETKATNDAKGDLRSDKAAESGDPRRAQAELRTLRNPALLLPDHWIVQAVGFDNGGKELVTASNQSFITIRRWDVVNKKLISEIKLQADKHGRAVRDGTLMFSGDRRRVVAATDEYVGIWDATTGKLLKQLPFKTKEGIYTCAIDMLDCTPDLSVIVGHRALPGRLTLSFDAHVFVWDGLSGNVVQTVIDKGATDLKSIDLSTDGKRLVTTNGSGAKIWETSTGQLLRSIPNDNTGRKHSEPDVSSQYTSHVWSVQFSPDGQQLAMGDILGVKLLDATSGKLLQQLEGPYRYSSSGSPGLVFSKDGQRLARLGTQEKVEGDKHRYVVPIWSTRTGARLFELHTESNDAAFSDDGQRLAVAFSDMQQALSVWSLSGKASDPEKTAGPEPHARQNRVEENGHYVGKKAAEFIEQFKPFWGNEKLGLQYGIALTKPQRKFRSGERVPLVVFFRNASDKPIKFDTAPDFFGNTPKVLNAKGEPIAFENIPLLGHIPHYHEKLAPGEALGPFYLSVGLGENPRSGQQHWHPYFKVPVAGQYKLTHSAKINVAGSEDGEKPSSDQIISGQIEFEIGDSK